MNTYPYLLVERSVLQGEVVIPSSKSQTLRAILFGSLGNGKTVIHEPLFSPDSEAMIEACISLGAEIKSSKDRIEIVGINGRITEAKKEIDVSNSGLSLRLITGIAALGSEPIAITGDDSIRSQRSMEPLLDAFSQGGVKAVSTNKQGYAPLVIQGPFQGGKVHVLGEDSQFVTSLLVTASFAQSPTEIFVQNPGEKPWVGMTLHWLDKLGAKYERKDFSWYRVLGKLSYEGFSYRVPGDFSTAAFPMAAALVTGSQVQIHNLDKEDCQEDKKLIEVFQKMGAEIAFHDKVVLVKKNAVLKGIEVDINDFIDSVTILAVVACFAKGMTRIKNASIARGKECNRLACIVSELRKMGAYIEETSDGLVIEGGSLHGAEVFSHHDHRMAMSLAVAGFGATGTTKVLASGCMQKTYPFFVRDLQKMGAHINEEKL